MSVYFAIKASSIALLSEDGKRQRIEQVVGESVQFRIRINFNEKGKHSRNLIGLM